MSPVEEVAGTMVRNNHEDVQRLIELGSRYLQRFPQNKKMKVIVDALSSSLGMHERETQSHKFSLRIQQADAILCGDYKLAKKLQDDIAVGSKSSTMEM